MCAEKGLKWTKIYIISHHLNNCIRSSEIDSVKSYSLEILFSYFYHLSLIRSNARYCTQVNYRCNVLDLISNVSRQQREWHENNTIRPQTKRNNKVLMLYSNNRIRWCLLRSSSFSAFPFVLWMCRCIRVGCSYIVMRNIKWKMDNKGKKMNSNNNGQRNIEKGLIPNNRMALCIYCCYISKNIYMLMLWKDRVFVWRKNHNKVRMISGW